LIKALDKLVLHTKPGAIGVAAAGVVDPAGRIVFSPNVGFDDPDIASVITERYGVSVWVGNDANAATFAEAQMGAGKGCRNMLMLTVGTGIGGGIVIDGEMYTGARGFAAELGHMTILDGGPDCACGNKGCLEAMASGTAIERMAADGLDDAPTSTLWNLTRGDVASITGEMVSDAAGADDAFAISILQDAGKYLGIGLASLAHAFDPELIVVGGGVLQTGGAYFQSAVEGLKDRYVASDTPPSVKRAELGNDAGMIGAAAMARRQLG
jgi:glucokinase